MKFFLLIFINFYVFATSVSVEIMDINKDFTVVSLDEYSQGFNPCSKIAEGVFCAYDNDKIYIKYNIKISISDIPTNSSLELYIDSNPTIGKEYTSVKIKRIGEDVIFPEYFNLESVLVYEINLELFRFGPNVKPEYDNLFELRISHII